MGSQAELTGPDLEAGIRESELGAEPVVGHAGGEAVLLVRDRGAIRAVAATCTHYGGPLGEGLIVDGQIHCPWHHACFDLVDGKPHGPALNPIACFDVKLEDGKIRVGAKREIVVKQVAGPSRVVIVGGGAAGVACAEALRQEGHAGQITVVSAEGTDPVDRPNLSKDILAGTAPEDWAFIRTTDMLREHKIELVAGEATEIDRGRKTITVGSKELSWDALVLATGAEPIRLPIEGAALPHVHTLRTLTDSRLIMNADLTNVVVIGASFIGLEAAASLRARGANVTVVGPEEVPLARVLGKKVGAYIRSVHESKGVQFRLGRKPAAIHTREIVLDDGTVLPASSVVMGVGVRPRISLAEAAGLVIDRGVVVDDQLKAADGIWAAGDIARYPWHGQPVRIEHWQVAVRHGQAVARSMLGQTVRQSVPFFWSQHHDVTLGYVGHAEQFDEPTIKGNLEARDAHVVYREHGVIRAVVTIGRDKLALEVDAAMDRGDAAHLETLTA